MRDPDRSLTSIAPASAGQTLGPNDTTASAKQSDGARDPDLPVRIDEFDGRLRDRLTTGSALLCCLDFDGTLAPIVNDPDEAALTAANRDALERLAAEPAIRVAIVSGRALSDLRSRVEPSVTLVGNHGLELGRDGQTTTHPVAASQSTTIATCCGLLRTVLDPIAGCHVEYKGVTGTVHIPSMLSSIRRHVYTTVETIVSDVAGDALTLSTGKDVIEIKPALDWGKGDAVELLESDEPADSRTLYIGDDTTDEHAFAAVEPGGVGILVGERPSTASRRVDSPAAVANLLEWLADVAADSFSTGRTSNTSYTTLHRT